MCTQSSLSSITTSTSDGGTKSIYTSADSANNASASSFDTILEDNVVEAYYGAVPSEELPGPAIGVPVAQPDGVMDAEVVESIRTLYNDEEFRRARYRNSAVASGMDYLVENLDRIAAVDYVPDGTDYLYAKSATKPGVHVTNLIVHGTPFQICDASSQMESGPKGWQNYFDNATATVYLFSMDIYDHPDLVRDARQKFKQTCRDFRHKPMILLFNKMDQFRRKVRCIPFKEKGVRNDKYDGPLPEECRTNEEFEAAIQAIQTYILQDYHKVWKRKAKEGGEYLYIHFVQSTAPEQIDTIFKAARDSLLRMNLKVSGLL